MTATAEAITLHDKGLSIDGKPFPWHAGTDVVITRLSGGKYTVTVDIFTDEVHVESIPNRCQLTIRDERIEESA